MIHPKLFARVAILAFAISLAAEAQEVKSVPEVQGVDTPEIVRTDQPAIPNSVPNPDPRVTESITMGTDDLHGFSSNELELAAAERVAMIAGVDPPGRHVSVAGFGEYRIEPGDLVEFISFDDESLKREVTVRYDGHISLPLIPDIDVGELTRPEAESLIRDAYAKVYRDPEISLTVVSPQSKSYVVMGDVEKPGQFSYTRATTLLQAINFAGGVAKRSSGGSESSSRLISVAGEITKAFVIRTVDGERRVNAYDLRDLTKPGRHDGQTPIFYGDIVYVPEGVNIVYLLGENRTPSIVEMNQDLTLLQMIALAGGYDPSTARIKEVVLLREVEEGKTDIHLVNLKAVLKNEENDVRLSPGDIVYIPRKRILRLQEFVQRFTGSLSPLLGLYGQAVDAFFAVDLSSARLDALESGASVSITQ